MRPGRSARRGDAVRFNCLTYALDRWRRDGGYLVFRRSTHWPIPHVLHLSGDMTELRHFVPPADLERPWHALRGFDGLVLERDEGPAAPVSSAGVVAGAALLFALACAWAVRRAWERVRGRI